jgi:hypothetical protein
MGFLAWFLLSLKVHCELLLPSMALNGRTELEFEIHSKIYSDTGHNLAKVVCLNIFSAKFPSSFIQNMKVWDFVDFSLKWERFESKKNKECDFGGFPASQGGRLKSPLLLLPSKTG